MGRRWCSHFKLAQTSALKFNNKGLGHTENVPKRALFCCGSQCKQGKCNVFLQRNCPWITSITQGTILQHFAYLIKACTAHFKVSFKACHRFAGTSFPKTLRNVSKKEIYNI